MNNKNLRPSLVKPGLRRRGLHLAEVYDLSGLVLSEYNVNISMYL